MKPDSSVVMKRNVFSNTLGALPPLRRKPRDTPAARYGVPSPIRGKHDSSNRRPFGTESIYQSVINTVGDRVCSNGGWPIEKYSSQMRAAT